jgi:hypothetical protein
MEKMMQGGMLDIYSKLFYLETILISDKVMKINQYEWAQSRALLITN